MSTDQVMTFVELYRSCSCLWYKSSPACKDRNARNEALQYISDTMNIPGFGPKEAAQKIKYIRATYKQERQKIMKSKTKCSSPDDVYKPRVPWFECADSFLRLPTVETRVLYKLLHRDDITTEESYSTDSSSYKTGDELCHKETGLPEHSSRNNIEQDSLPQRNSSKKYKLKFDQPLIPSYIRCV